MGCKYTPESTDSSRGIPLCLGEAQGHSLRFAAADLTVPRALVMLLQQWSGLRVGVLECELHNGYRHALDCLLRRCQDDQD